MTDVIAYTSNPENREIMRKEIARRERVIAKRKADSKYKGALLTLGAISVLAGIGTRILHTDEVNAATNSNVIKQEIDSTITSSGVNSNISVPAIESKADNEINSNVKIDINQAAEQIKKTNITEVLEPGDVVEFERAYVGKYEYSNEYGGTWTVASENENSNDTKWCFAMHRENGNYGYVSTDSLEEFKPYLAKDDGLFYRTKLNNPCDGKIECAAGSIVYIDDTKKFTSDEGYEYYKVLVQDKIDNKNGVAYKYSVGYAGMSQVEKSDKDFSLGVVTQKTAVRSSPELKGDVFEYEKDDSEKGVKYIVDISSYSPKCMQDYKDTLTTLQSKGVLGGVIMEIARSNTDGSFKVGCMTGNAELDEKNNEIKNNTKNMTSYSMGDYNQFKTFVEETMDMCPVGFYVYVDTIESDKAEALANIVYETENQLSKDINQYENAKKFPMMIDIETGEDKDREARTQTAIDFINKLGNLDVISNQYMFYTMPAGVVAKKSDISKGSQITCIEDIQEGTPDYTLINVGASYVNGMLNTGANSKEYKDNLEPQNLLNSMYSTKAYSEPFYMSHENIKEADIMQCMGNINYNNHYGMKIPTQVIDISVCPTDTYNAILDGTFKGHEGTFLSNMSKSIEEYKNKTSNREDNEIKNNIQQQDYERD